MNAPISIATAERYMWGNGCDGWHLLRNEALSVIQERMPPGTSEVRHRHRNARQFFFVLLGQLHIEIDGVAHVVDPGSGLEVAPGLAHQVFNRGSVDASFLVVSQPPGQGDRELVPHQTVMP